MHLTNREQLVDLTQNYIYALNKKYMCLTTSVYNIYLANLKSIFSITASSFVKLIVVIFLL